MTTDSDLFRRVDCILGRARLAEFESAAVAEGARRGGLALIRLIPTSDVIQIVVLDGTHLGRVRHEYPGFLPERWIAVPGRPQKARGPYRTAVDAARALIVLPSISERNAS